MIDRCGEQILADFQQYYGLDLAQVIRPGSGYSPIRVLYLIRQLPLESRTYAEIRGGAQFVGWGQDRYLLANVIDAIQQTTYAVVAANSKRKPKAPKPVERPSNKRNAGAFAQTARMHLQAAKQAQGG
ncbi:hypothetical protein OU416_06905 [Saccharopolyspora indica]|uniref:hypothetical protein n=1 Tax=Saccharopolyspora indica TaxID=1229659 RepID=UPI0022EA2731|nr:hypothetical protein [Saccharopolyspora indica]MDA3643779.1 hypothetical protein [Saccharopolyspora indica]